MAGEGIWKYYMVSICLIYTGDLVLLR